MIIYIENGNSDITNSTQGKGMKISRKVFPEHEKRS